MFIRLLKVLLFVPVMALGVTYFMFAPLWYIIFNQEFNDVIHNVDSWAEKFDEWE